MYPPHPHILLLQGWGGETTCPLLALFIWAPDLPRQMRRMSSTFPSLVLCLRDKDTGHDSCDLVHRQHFRVSGREGLFSAQKGCGHLVKGAKLCALSTRLKPAGLRAAQRCPCYQQHQRPASLSQDRNAVDTAVLKLDQDNNTGKGDKGKSKHSDGLPGGV